jgi:hypothetical protein
MSDGGLGAISLGDVALPLMPMIAAFALVGSSMWLIHTGVGCPWSRGALLGGAAVCVVVNSLIHTVLSPQPGMSVMTIAQFGLANVGILAASICIGKLVAVWVERPSWIIPICLVALSVDVWSVYFGPTGEVVEAVAADPMRAEAAQRFLIWYPNLSAAGPEELVVKPSLGIGDFIFAALLLQLALVHGLRLRASLLAIIGATLLALFSAALRPCRSS